jgi:hypothetical protein
MYVFATSTPYKGNLGGLAGADAKCEEAAKFELVCCQSTGDWMNDRWKSACDTAPFTFGPVNPSECNTKRGQDQGVIDLCSSHGDNCVVDELNWKCVCTNVEGTYKAWLSTTGVVDARDRFDSDTKAKLEVRLVDDTVVGDTLNTILNGAQLSSPINKNELGDIVPDYWIWTNTKNPGISYSDDQKDCGKFTSGGSGARARAGNSGSTDEGWTSNNVGSSVYAWCNNEFRLYCFQDYSIVN